MKKISVSVLFVIASLAIVNTSKAQVNVNINIGTQPEWGPSGYDYAEYYYLPDIESYYYVPKHQFVYFSGNQWNFSPSLPAAYSNYDLYSGYKVVVNKPRAYRYFDDDRVRYARYKNYNNHQEAIKYKHDNGNHYGQYKNKGEGKGKGRGKAKGHGKGHD
jgi:hypothetical protein